MGLRSHQRQERLPTGDEKFKKAQRAQKRRETQRCGRCKKVGHNKQGCQASSAEAEASVQAYKDGVKQARAAERAARCRSTQASDLLTANDDDSFPDSPSRIERKSTQHSSRMCEEGTGCRPSCA